jgi:hypothetical protein
VDIDGNADVQDSVNANEDPEASNKLTARSYDDDYKPENYKPENYNYGDYHEDSRVHANIHNVGFAHNQVGVGSYNDNELSLNDINVIDDADVAKFKGCVETLIVSRRAPYVQID